MKNTLKNLVVVALLMISGASFASIEAGKDYTVLQPTQPTSGTKIEVLEFFFYGCSHCYNLHPKLIEWEKNMPKDVELTYVPTIFRDSMESMARTFYALETLGSLEPLHEPLYKAWNVENLQLFEESTIADFVANKGVDSAKFSAAFNSFSMQSKVTRAKQMTRSYRISGTPTLIVAGKYAISGLQPSDTIRVLKEVIDMVRKEQQRRK